MNTPDDPVIHSPPSLRLNQVQNSGGALQQSMQSIMQPGNGNFKIIIIEI